jgi:hypothetical protein
VHWNRSELRSHAAIAARCSRPPLVSARP